MRLIVTLALVLGIAGTALGVYTLVDEDEEEGLEEQTLTLTEKEDTFEINDVAPPSRGEEDVSPNDSFTFTSDISGDREGRLVGECVAATEEFEVSCVATYKFEDGDIELAGSPDFEQAEAAGFEIAVVGGTGAYAGASGTASLPEDAEEEPTVVELLLPEDADDAEDDDD